MGTARRRLVVGLAAPLLAVGGMFAVACSLGLDESLLDARPDGGLLADGAPADTDGTTPGGGDGGADAGGIVACSDDTPCKSTDGCTKGHCDLGRKVCVYDVCRSTCGASACALATHVCAATTAYKMKVAQFPLGGSVCGHCAVASYPWLFAIVGTNLVAFDVSNPAGGSPPKIPITGLDFTPTQIVRSGNRVWLSGAIGGQPAATVPLAYIDVPTNAFVTSIAANSGRATYTTANPAAGLFLFPRADATALIVSSDTQFPSGTLTPPLSSPGALTLTAIPAAPGVGPALTTGTRLLLSGTTADIPIFQLIQAAGGTAPQGGAVASLNATGTVSTSHALASSDLGAVFWAGGLTNAPTALPPDPGSTRALHGAFLIPSATADFEPAPPGVDVEVYNDLTNVVAIGTAVVAPIAMLDSNTAIIPAMAHENAAQTSIQFVQRTPLGLVSDGATTRRTVLGFGVQTVAATTASDGISYVIANDQAPPNAATAYVFDVGCAP